MIHDARYEELVRRVAAQCEEPVKSALLWALGDEIDGAHPIGKALLVLSLPRREPTAEVAVHDRWSPLRKMVTIRPGSTQFSGPGVVVVDGSERYLAGKHVLFRNGFRDPNHPSFVVCDPDDVLYVSRQKEGES